MNRFKSPAKGFVFVSLGQDTLLCRLIQGSWVLCWALGRALRFLPMARQHACDALLNFQGCRAHTPPVPRPWGGSCTWQVRPGARSGPLRAPSSKALGRAARLRGRGKGRDGGGASRPGHRPRPARGSFGCSGPGWRGGDSGGAGERLPVRLRGGEGEGGASPEACAQTVGRWTDARRETAGGEVSIRWERGRRAEGRRRGQPGTRGRGRGGRRRARGRLRSGVGPETLSWPVRRAASVPRQRKAQPPLASPSVSFLSNQRKINTREGKTIAGPPGTRRARSSHVWRGGRRWNREWRPHVGAPSRCAPAEGGATRRAGLGRRRREFPGVRRVGKVLQEQSGFPQLPFCG